MKIILQKHARAWEQGLLENHVYTTSIQYRSIAIYVTLLPMLGDSHLHPSLYMLRVQLLEQVGLEVTTSSQEHPSGLRLPKGHTRSLTLKQVHSSFRIAPLGHIGSVVPVQSDVCSVIWLPAGQVGLALIRQVQVLVLNENPLGHVGGIFLSQAHRLCGCTVGV